MATIMRGRNSGRETAAVVAPKHEGYDDRFVTIDAATRTLQLKHYYLPPPLTSTHSVHIPALLYIRAAPQAVHRIFAKPQGLSPGGIFWALDCRRGVALRGPDDRGYARSFVIKAKGDVLQSGFSVEDPERFLEVLEGIHPGLTQDVVGEQGGEDESRAMRKLI